MEFYILYDTVAQRRNGWVHTSYTIVT